MTRNVTLGMKALFVAGVIHAVYAFHGAYAEDRPDSKPNSRVMLISASSSAPGPKPPDHLFEGGTFEARPGTQFVKLALTFDPPVVVSRLVVESCASEFKDGIEFFVFPGSRRIYAEGGFESVTANLGSSGDDGVSAEVRALALNFRHNQNLCIKSLRFKDAAGELVEVKAKLEPEAQLVPGSETFRKSFSKSEVAPILDQELVYRNENDRWLFRFRGDGTFFIFGTNDDGKSAGRFTALGEFEVIKVAKTKITLQLKGQRLVTPEPWDGFLCGKLCGGRSLAAAKAVSDVILVEKLKSGFMVRNRIGKSKRTLPFSDVHARISTI